MKLLIFLQYFLCAIGTTQMIPYLTNLGYTGSEKGIILSMIAFSTIVLQFISGYVSDKTKKIKMLFIIIFLIFLISNSLLFIFHSDAFLYYVLLICLIGGCYRCSQGLLDSWIVQLHKSNFSSIRAYGALGWASGSILLANIYNTYGYNCIPIILVFVGLLSLIVSFKIRDSKRSDGVIVFSDIQYIIKNRKYMLFVAIVFLLYALGCADMYIVVDKILYIGGSEWEVGMKWGLQSLLEIPILLVGNCLLKRFGVIKLMIFASTMFIIRFIVYGLIDVPYYFLYASIFQLVTFPIVVFCSREEFDNLIDEKLKTTAQMFAMSLYMGVSLFVMPIVCNWLVNRIGYDTSLFVLSSMGLLTIMLLCIYKKI